MRINLFLDYNDRIWIKKRSFFLLEANALVINDALLDIQSAVARATEVWAGSSLLLLLMFVAGETPIS